VIVEGGSIAYVAGFGSAGPGRGPVTPHTPFVLGSVSKSFTALAAAQLMAAGRLDRDAPVQRYLPWFRLADAAASAQISVRHLLSHTSGISTYTGRRGSDEAEDALGLQHAVRQLADVELSAAPGARYEYSNTNYQVLGAVIEASSGQAYAEYVERQVFAPLGMLHSHAHVAAARADGLATGHRYWFTRPVATPQGGAGVSSMPAGHLMSSAEDLGRYLLWSLGDGHLGETRLLPAANIEQLFQPLAEIPSGNQYAMGWMLTPSANGLPIWHTGSTPSFHSHVALDRASQRGFALLINAESYLTGPLIWQLGREVTRALRGEEPRAIQGPGIPLKLAPLLLLVLLQALACARLIHRWRKRQPSVPPEPQRGRWPRQLLLPWIYAAALGTVALVLAPRSQDLTWTLLTTFAPDAGYSLLALALLAITWSALKSALWIRSRRSH
jgi:CubicO group peptidase (beta-lactamase class C family)